MTEAPPTQETPRERPPKRKATPARKKPRKPDGVFVDHGFDKWINLDGTWKKRKKKPRQPKSSPEAELLHEIIAAMLAGYGPGGLTALASALKLTPSNLRKRMASPRGAWDSATILAYVAAKSWKAELFTTEPIRTARVGRFEIAVQDTDAGQIPTWREIAE